MEEDNFVEQDREVQKKRERGMERGGTFSGSMMSRISIVTSTIPNPMINSSGVLGLAAVFVVKSRK